VLLCIVKTSMRRKIPSLQALACFDAAARSQSYTRAAQELALTQSAVSRQIATLEAYLGLELFRRTRHGVMLTAAGSQYARQIAPRLQALERDTLDAMSGQGDGGAVTLAVVPTFGARWLVPRLPQFQAAHPDVVVHLESRTRPFLFADTELDGALFAGTPPELARWAGTRAIRLLPEMVQPVCAPSLLAGRGAFTLEALGQQPLLQQSTRAQAWLQWFESASPDAPPARALAGPRYEQFSMSAAAAVAGLGIALAPLLLIEQELAQGSLVPAHPHVLAEARHYYLVLPEDGQGALRPALQALVDWLQVACRPTSQTA
jgi:DNA-binding transcriptional LysR family regulator